MVRLMMSQTDLPLSF
jgi:hypothetical protein